MTDKGMMTVRKSANQIWNQSKSEVVLLALGQAGAQISNAVWELLCLEHGIGPNGQFEPDHIQLGCQLDNKRTFFQESSNGHHVPRTLIIDLEPTVVGTYRTGQKAIWANQPDTPLMSFAQKKRNSSQAVFSSRKPTDEIRTGTYHALFHPDQLVTAGEDASNNYARGFYSLGRRLIDRITIQLRRVVEACDALQGFLVLNSFGGGTGSGLTSLLLMNLLNTSYSKQTSMQIGICPGSKVATGIVEPYNCILGLNSSIDHTQLNVLLDNESLYNVCHTALKLEHPSFEDTNRLVSFMLSCLTVSLRSESTLGVNLDQMRTNLVPYPRIHYPILSCAPFYAKDRFNYERQSISELTRLLFEPSSNQMLNADLRAGQAISCWIQYRGDVPIQDVVRAIRQIKTRDRVQFVDWCPTGFKVGIANQPPVVPSFSPMAPIRRCAALLVNTSAINQAIDRMTAKFDQLYRKRAFVHWYVNEGMEEAEFHQAREGMTRLEQDYQELVGPIRNTVTKDIALRGETSDKTPDKKARKWCLPC